MGFSPILGDTTFGQPTACRNAALLSSTQSGLICTSLSTTDYFFEHKCLHRGIANTEDIYLCSKTQLENKSMPTSKQYGGITRSELDRLREDLAAEGVVVPDGDDVTFDATHRVLLRAVYDEAKETLSISIVKKPFFVPESQIWGVLDTGVAPYVGDARLLASSGKETFHKHRLFRFAAKQHLRQQGYSSDQAARLVGELGDGTILEFIKKWGPTLLKILMMLLPLFAAKEAPKGKPIKGAKDFIDPNEMAD